MLRRIYDCSCKTRCHADCDASWWCYRHDDSRKATTGDDSDESILASSLGCMAVEIIPVEEVKNGLA